MRSVKAREVLPRSLLAEIQKYVQGETIYIPKLPTNYEKWGANTDSKGAVALRNERIAQAFKAGATIPELSKAFHLSVETIKKIVYRRGTL